MNLNSAVFDNVLAIDERLRQLEEEVQQMEPYYTDKAPQPINQIPSMSATIDSQQQINQSQEGIILQSHQNKKSVTFSEDQQQKSLQNPLQQQRQNISISTRSYQQSRYQNLPPVGIDAKILPSVQSSTSSNYNHGSVGNTHTNKSIINTTSQAIVISNISSMAKVIKPQISKEYATALILGRPDLTIIEDEFEKGDKFYEPQYSMTKVANRESEENGRGADIRFRESESQIIAEQSMIQEALRKQAQQFYDSFM